MQEEVPFYIQVLERELKAKRGHEENYSLRSFAKHLGVSPGLLSDVLSQKKNIPKKRLEFMMSQLQLNPEEKERFCTSHSELMVNLSRLAKVPGQISPKEVLDNNLDYKILVDWEYYATFALFDICKCLDPETVAERLEISFGKATEILQAFYQRKLLEKDGHQFFRVNDARLTTTQDVPSKALREGHKNVLDLAKVKIDEVPVDHRFFTSTTLALDKSKIKQAKKIYREFRDKLTPLLEEGEPSDVYQFNFSMFPLSKIDSNS